MMFQNWSALLRLKFKRLLFLGFLAFGFPRIACAQQFSMLGMGSSSCGTWVADWRESGDPAMAVAEESWVFGFLSGIGYSTTNDPLHNMDPDGVVGWFDNYCIANPINTIEQAAAAFAKVHPN
jgi:hypothetical protein